MLYVTILEGVRNLLNSNSRFQLSWVLKQSAISQRRELGVAQIVRGHRGECTFLSRTCGHYRVVDMWRFLGLLTNTSSPVGR